ncbi:MAG TPA: hypothetical protein VF865_16865 [Acidobacteriaceae bacterium]
MFSARKTSASLIAALALLAAAGCHSKTAATPENFIVGLNAHFADHPECIFPTAPTFPYETSDMAEIKQMNTLVTNQLLTASSERSIHASRYTPTPAGARYAPRFCYGHRVATSIDSFTPPATANGFTETNVTYHYSMEDVPVWAKSADIQAAFPKMAHNISGTATDKATLASTMAGWQVPD